MSFDNSTPLEVDIVKCSVCGQSFTPSDNEKSPSYFPCGHSICYKCIQDDWCKSVSNEGEIVGCPVCMNQALVCLESEDVKANMSEILNDPPSIITCPSVPDCNNVLICQTSNSSETYENLPLTSSLMDISHLNANISSETPAEAGDLVDKSWSMDLMNLQSVLDKKPVLSPPHTFPDPTETDIGSVQDILKIVNMQGDSLLDDCSINTFFSSDESWENPPRRSSISASELSDFSQFFHTPPRTNPWGSLSVGQSMSDSHIADGYGRTYMSGGPRRGRPSHKTPRGRGKKRQRGRINRGRSSIFLETCAAVDSIQESDDTVEVTIAAVKENLYDRFYPKSLRGQQVRKRARSIHNISDFPSPKDSLLDIDVDLQMVKIMSKVNVAEKEVEHDQNDKSKHNYGYVKNLTLSDGNEIKNLYVVPKTWLNSEEVEMQFPVRSATPLEPQIQFDKPVSGTTVFSLPDQSPESLVQYFPRNFLEKVTSPAMKCSSAQTDLYLEDVKYDNHWIEDSPVHVPSEPRLTNRELYDTDMIHVQYEINNGRIRCVPEDERVVPPTPVKKKPVPEAVPKKKVNSSEEKTSESLNTSRYVTKGTNTDDTLLDSSDSNDSLVIASYTSKIKVTNRSSSTSQNSSHSSNLSKNRSSQNTSKDDKSLSCADHLSSPDSLRAEDLQEWYKSTENSKSGLDVSEFFAISDLSAQSSKGKICSAGRDHKLKQDSKLQRDTTSSSFGSSSRLSCNESSSPKLDTYLPPYTPPSSDSEKCGHTLSSDSQPRVCNRIPSATLLTSTLDQITDMKEFPNIDDIQRLSNVIHKLDKLCHVQIDKDIIDMINQQVSLVLASVKTVQCFAVWQHKLSPIMHNLFAQRQMILDLISNGVSFISELVGRCEHLLEDATPQSIYTMDTCKSNTSELLSSVPSVTSRNSNHCDSEPSVTSRNSNHCDSEPSKDSSSTVINNSDYEKDIHEAESATLVVSNIAMNVEVGCSESANNSPPMPVDSSGTVLNNNPLDPDYTMETEESDIESEEVSPEGHLHCCQTRGMKRKCLSDSSDQSATQKATQRPRPRRHCREEQRQTPQRCKRPLTPTKGARNRRKKCVKKKNVYSSSSEEIIRTPIRRGFQYTEDCFKVFNAVYNHSRSDTFCKEVKSSEVPGYYKIIKRAMWLDLVAHKLRSSRYDQLVDYVSDMRLIFANSHLFNKKGSEEYCSGKICEELFEQKLIEYFPDKHL